MLTTSIGNLRADGRHTGAAAGDSQVFGTSSGFRLKDTIIGLSGHCGTPSPLRVYLSLARPVCNAKNGSARGAFCTTLLNPIISMRRNKNFLPKAINFPAKTFFNKT